MIELRTPAEIEQMRPAGRFVAETLATLKAETTVTRSLLPPSLRWARPYSSDNVALASVPALAAPMRRPTP